MELSKLADQVKKGEIEAVHLVTMEGGSYVMHAMKGGKSQPIIDAKGGTLHIASLEEARKNLKGVPEVPLFLVQPAVYDEMVGLGDTDRQPNREPIPWHSSL
ncbi:hypothetical protein ALP94_01877 [Pseudomonas savastanoi pv. glycinea]|uniref:DUF6482 family protein n=1 Tax=Pseudomonas quasicaspiana TaxID=2829821 RepID=UPI000EFE101D|nr:DUF6482 family protein [Pseudomonas quasicaspiana]MCD5975140.1 cation transporter [Pseudomonas quasicaspiana]MCD5981140.1 cation transporter [Pseudomonas quasicaspiana]MCD5988911.1 cation transporter [Pseudomonas quasicaspiana]RMQ99860.1 hypothetical protein ALP94_01877 [Pseudomonas savastanoi pv. glycinea]